MKKDLLKTYFVLTTVLCGFLNAQNINVIDTNQKPLTNVLVFDQAGNLLAKTDIDGNFDKKSIEPLQGFYILKQENTFEDTINSTEISKDTIVLNNRVSQIPEVIISNVLNPNYVVIKGFFNNYITLNNKLNCYVDGIIEYTFDSKNNNFISSNIIQYRTFILKEKNIDRKKVSTFSFTIVGIPELEKITKLEKLKNEKKVVFKEKINSKTDKTELEYLFLKSQDKEISILGYRISLASSSLLLAFSKGKNYNLIKDLSSFNNSYQLNIKHKTEGDYNTLKSYSNFYPDKIYYLKDKKKRGKLKLNKDKSNYIDSYWQNSVLESSYNTFSNFFKTDLVEQPNSSSNK